MDCFERGNALQERAFPDKYILFDKLKASHFRDAFSLPIVLPRRKIISISFVALAGYAAYVYNESRSAEKRRKSMTDQEIIKLIHSSPHEGHRLLFDRYYSYVYAISVNILRNFGTAEDVEECVIDIFAAVLNKLDEINYESIKPFIGTVAKNTAISLRRSLAAKAGKSISLDEEEFSRLSSEERIDRNAENAELSKILLEKIKELGEPDSTIIIQRYFYERNAKEIGSMIGMNHSAVRMRCSRAVKKLRGLMKDFC